MADDTTEATNTTDAGSVSKRVLSYGEQLRLTYGYPLVTARHESQGVKRFQEHSQKYWEHFYRANGDRFFRDRHWIIREFPELVAHPSSPAAAAADLVLDVGCGVGNTLFPVDAATGGIYRWIAFDLSATAVEILQEHPAFDPRRHAAFVHDFVAQPCPPALVPRGGCRFAVLFFVLSAVAPHLHQQALRHLWEALAEDGLLLFRDYERSDTALARFADSGRSQLGAHFFVRQDGTQAYFFQAAELAAVATAAGFVVERLDCVARDLENKKEELHMKDARRFLQAVFRKVSSSPTA
jgi:methyltransferase-like protein 6